MHVDITITFSIAMKLVLYQRSGKNLVGNVLLCFCSGNVYTRAVNIRRTPIISVLFRCLYRCFLELCSLCTTFYIGT